MASDPTFRSYKPAQARQYAGARLAYPSVLYDHIFAEHEASGGGLGFVLDVGCGPGSATRDLASAFEHAVGVDPGEGMINVARERGGETSKGEKIRYEVCEAERLTDVPDIPLGGVDLLTSATAAHWFDMKKFWPQAAQLVRPGGTVAIWTRGQHYAHPDMPRGAEINEIQSAFQRTVEPYMQPGNLIAHEMYDNLELPWAADPTQTAFPKDKFQRFDWDRGGLSDGKDFFGGSQEFPMAVYEQALGTVSAVTRWREAHPELVGTERDCVTEALAKLRQVLGDQMLRGGGATALLMFKRAE
ncbi:S-adenosyl-L-methionine-dependent methyltransferase [Glonium stellatum]|uniref:S-adenosyl-L-methionine-dependent methyltransferase n=1 Tax=Glonium stellatum TaxID=574774 RepID=A0A8E2EPV4_9PEZI|nr:S-adenosyl-L-methionine-dependent methyltransferase [Glonium stellatum]